MELTARSWILGMTLRWLRESAGLTAEIVAKKYMQCSTSRIFAIEGGYRQINALELDGLVKVYGRGDLLPRLENLRALIASGSDSPIADPIAKHPETSLYEELERMSVSILNTTIDTVPGLCQTHDYTRLQYIMEGNDPETADRYATARVERQERLLALDQPPMIDLLITESAIHRAAYVPGQLVKLAERARHPSIAIRSIPTSIGPHLTACNFTILEFAGFPSVLSTHVVAGGGLMTDQSDVELAMTRRMQLMQHAESPERTLAVIEDTREK